MDARARSRLVDEHLPLVRAVAAQIKRYLPPSIELDELVSYGAAGLLEAAERYDDRHGVTFSTFAYYRVRGAIFDGLRQIGHLPRTEYARLRAHERAHEYLSNLQDREIGARAQGGAPATTLEDEAEALYSALSGVVTSFVTSLEALAEAGEEFLDETADDPAERIHVRELSPRVRTALAALPEKERHFIEKHYFEGKTLLEAGQELGLSKSWASRLHARAIELLRDQLNDSS